MDAGVANRIAALGLWAIHIAERSGTAAAHLLEQGIKPPIGSGHPVEVFTLCGAGAAEVLFNTMMPNNVKMRTRFAFQDAPHLHQIAVWENDSGDRRVITLHAPDHGVYLTICQGTPHMARPIQSATSLDAMHAHNTLILMVRAGQL